MQRPFSLRKSAKTQRESRLEESPFPVACDMVPPMARMIGLSGGIGSGKTTVRKLLESMGARTVCADEVVHELQAPGQPLLQDLAEAFGEAVIQPDGALDRKALGEVVFNDAEARARLGAIMHPPVVAEIVRRAQAAAETDTPLVVVDIPLLFEGVKTQTGSAVALPYEALVLVWIPREMQIKRTAQRDQSSEEDAEKRVAAQMPIDEKRAMASHVIDNSGTQEETAEQVRALWETLTGVQNS